ncbi:GATOR2 complex protein MIOS-B-like [Watersipora subatra]|uniref:GATOR2 complex protein MIOS-B-like n=1 Tax=Watersipora subatra TaxID=2589382 RepID=UPI00355AE913
MLASHPQLDIFWSASDRNKYLVFGSELFLYQVDEQDHNISTEHASDEPGTYGKFLARYSETQFAKCMSWYPKADKDYLVAIGQANGSISLISLDKKKIDDLIGREYVPKHGRTCFCLEWSVAPSSPTMLAAGLDKYRSDASLLIWDVTRIAPDVSLSSSDKYSISSDEPKLGKPIAELGTSEATYSLAWTSSNTIVTGMNKYLRVVDIRDPCKFVKTTQTKAVYGISVDPQNEERGVASFIENQVCIWDMRSFNKALHTLPLQKAPIVKIGWCPKRSGLLACLSRDSTAIQVFDIQHSFTRDYEYDLTVSGRPVETPYRDQIASFAWHPFDENRLLSINVDAGVCNLRMFERIALDMNPSGTAQELCFSQVKQLGFFKFDNCNDISSVMRSRAINMYGLQHLRDDNSISLEIEPNKPETELWKWAEHLTRLVESDGHFSMPEVGADGVSANTHLIGAKHVLEKLNSHKIFIDWQGSADETLPPLVHYENIERGKCLKICQWPCRLESFNFAEISQKTSEDLNMPSSGEPVDYVTAVTSRLEQEGFYEKATAIALFHGKIDDALKILNRGSEYAIANETNKGINLSIVAMALAGINTTNNALWLSKCRELHNKIDNPYLRATFAFLTCSNSDYDQILSSKSGISIADRVAFACIFLPDVELRAYISSLQAEVISEGNLSGVLVTGLEEAGVELLQKYIDNTGDIQTATLIMIHSFPSRMQEDERVVHWIEHYRDLLDEWKLWVLRAKFDIFHKEFVERIGHKGMTQVYLSCNFCNKANTPLQMQQRRMYTAGGYGQKPNSVKIALCNECRKPLPRCTLCLKYMGTASGILSAIKQSAGQSRISAADSPKDHSKKKKANILNRSAEFSNWFTWCQSCRHGGHAIHIEEWFKGNAECPVSGCACKCASLDGLPVREQLDVNA